MCASDAIQNLARELDDLIATVDLADDAAVLETVQRVFEFRPVLTLLDDVRLSTLKTKLAEGLSAVEAREVCTTWRELRCANSNIVDWNPLQTEGTGSNTASYFLGVGEGALGAMFYISSYLIKEAGKLNVALALMLDAHQHLDAYGSKAADKGTPERDARFLMQRALIKADSELALTQGTALLIGLKASSSTESFSYVDNWSAYEYAQTISIDPIEMDDENDGIEHDAGASDAKSASDRIGLFDDVEEEEIDGLFVWIFLYTDEFIIVSNSRY